MTEPGFALSRVSPSIWPTAGGVQMELSGRGFQSGAAVSIAGLPVADPVVVDPSRIQLLLPSRLGSLGAVPIRITNPDGSSITRSDLFSFSASQIEFFGAPMATGSTPLGLAIADLNRDGHQDIVVASSGSDTLSVFLGAGLGRFASSKQLAVGKQPRAVLARDVNGDGIPDLAAVCPGSDAVSVLLGDGSGGFAAQQLVPAGTAPTGLVAADA